LTSCTMPNVHLYEKQWSGPIFFLCMRLLTLVSAETLRRYTWNIDCEVFKCIKRIISCVDRSTTPWYMQQK
jgi:hypothetical protein